MTTVVATGVFELIHPGHILFLEEARKLGDRLVVIVASDRKAAEKRRLVIPAEQRLHVVKSLKPVDDAMVGDSEDMFKPILKVKPDVIALGRDQKFDDDELRRMLAERGLNVKVVRIREYWDKPLHASKKIIEEFRKHQTA